MQEQVRAAFEEALAKHRAGELAAAEAAYRALGRDAQGWALYDQRPERRTNQAHALSFPEWRGEDLTGKRLFVWTEQGFGDQILAARFIPHLRAAHVTFVCSPPLAPLFA